MQALAHLEKHVLDKRTLCPAIARIHVKLLLASVVHDTLKMKSSHSTYIEIHVVICKSELCTVQ